MNQRNTFFRFDESVKFLYSGCKDSLQRQIQGLFQQIFLNTNNFYYYKYFIITFLKIFLSLQKIHSFYSKIIVEILFLQNQSNNEDCQNQ